MKKILSFILTTCFVLNSYGQEESTEEALEMNKHSLSISGGLSKSLGNFYKKGFQNNMIGSAELGRNLNIAYRYALTEKIGINARWYNTKHNAAIFERRDHLSEKGAKFPIDYAEEWKANSFFLGADYKIPLKEKLTINSKIMGGYMSLNSPEMSYSNPITTSSNDIKYSTSSDQSFAYLLGLGLTYEISEKISCFVNLEYIAAAFKFNDITWENNAGESDTIDFFEQDYEVLNTSLGLSYHF